MRQHHKEHIPIDPASLPDSPAHTLLAQLISALFPSPSASAPVLIAIGGAGGSGKSTFAGLLSRALGGCPILHLDHYKIPRSQRQAAGIWGPHPDANQMALLHHHLSELRMGLAIESPLYCQVKGTSEQAHTFTPGPITLVEGEISTYPAFHPLIDLSLFIDSHWKTQLNTRLTRDIEHRGHSPEKAIANFLHSNLREFPQFGAESRRWADVVLFCGPDYSLSLHAICPRLAHLVPGHSRPAP